MLNSKIVYLAIGLMAVSIPKFARADETNKVSTSNREELREKFQNLSPEEREAKRKEFMEKRSEMMKKGAKEIGLDPDELEKLPPEERRAKVKEAVDKKITELQKKKDDGSITDSEKELLTKLEQRKKIAERFQNGRGAQRPGRPAKPSDK
jgi:hypothetical protein